MERCFREQVIETYISYTFDLKKFNMKIKSDVLTESEKQFFIDKILTHYHERDAKKFIEWFEYFPDDYLKQDFARIDNGFAVLKSNASAFLWGKFYVVKNNDFYSQFYLKVL